MTDFENAAFITFMQLLVNLLNTKQMNTALPIRISDINLETARTRDAIHKEKFFWPTSLNPQKQREVKNVWDTSPTDSTEDPIKNEYTEMSLSEIMESVIPLLTDFINEQNYTEEQKEYTLWMIDFLYKRSKGEILTGAAYLREFVKNHPKYEQDSYVNSRIVYDLVRHVALIGGHKSEECCEAPWPVELLG